MKDPFFTMTNLGKGAITTAAVQTAAVDIRDYDDHVHFTFAIHNVAKSASRTLDATIQHSASGTAGWTDVEGGAITQVGNVDGSVQHLVLQAKEMKRYIRVSYTRASSGSSFIAFCTMLGWKDPTPAAT